MSIPLSPPIQVDVGEAFGFVFRSRNWFGRLAVGALCLLFFWLFLIPLFILLGYFVETARTVSRGESELPPWTDVGKKLREGFVLSVVLFIWGLPGSILSWGSYPIYCMGSSCTYNPSAFAPVGGLYSLLLGLLTAAIWSQYLEGGFGAAFDFRAIFRRAGLQPGMTVSEVERLLILRTLEFTSQNRTQAARMLGISIRTLRNKLHEYREEGAS